jgi:hypothetical protein
VEVAHWEDGHDMRYIIIDHATGIDNSLGVKWMLDKDSIYDFLQYEEEGTRKEEIRTALKTYSSSDYMWYYCH